MYRRPVRNVLIILNVLSLKNHEFKRVSLRPTLLLAYASII